MNSITAKQSALYGGLAGVAGFLACRYVLIAPATTPIVGAIYAATQGVIHTLTLRLHAKHRLISAILHVTAPILAAAPLALAGHSLSLSTIVAVNITTIIALVGIAAIYGFALFARDSIKENGIDVLVHSAIGGILIFGVLVMAASTSGVVIPLIFGAAIGITGAGFFAYLGAQSLRECFKTPSLPLDEPSDHCRVDNGIDKTPSKLPGSRNDDPTEPSAPPKAPGGL